MADSLLDVVDWTDLTTAEYLTAYRVLMSATSERISIAAMRQDGTFNTGGGSILNPEGWEDYFPHSGNAGTVGNDGDPYIPLTTQESEDFLSKACLLYIDHENITNIIGTDVTTVGRWTEARIFSHFSITEWPDLSILNKEALKQWYDILTGACKYVTPLWSLDYKYQWTGIFDGSRSGTGDSLKAERDYAGDLTTFNSDYGNLYTGPYQEDTDSGLTYEPNCERPYWITAESPSTLKSLIYQTDIILDLTDARTALGFNGEPLSSRYFDNYDLNTANAQTTDVLFEPTCNQSITTDVVTSTVVEPTITNPISGGLPSPSESYLILRKNINTATVGFGFVSLRLIWDWDGDGGFEYYTPP